jgi:hypothetical protein
MGRFCKAALIGGFTALFAALAPASALEMRPILTLDVARKIVDGCLAKAQQQDGRCTSRCSILAAT